MTDLTGVTFFCWVCDTHLTTDQADHRDKHGCGRICLPECETADRMTREDHS